MTPAEKLLKVQAIITRCLHAEHTDPDRYLAQVRAALIAEGEGLDLEEAYREEADRMWLMRPFYAYRGLQKRETMHNADRMSREGWTRTVEVVAKNWPALFAHGVPLPAASYADVRWQCQTCAGSAVSAARDAVFWNEVLSPMKPGQKVGDCWTPKDLLKLYALCRELRSVRPSREVTPKLQFPKGLLPLPSREAEENEAIAEATT